jgi:hypothetical protein
VPQSALAALEARETGLARLEKKLHEQAQALSAALQRLEAVLPGLAAAAADGGARGAARRRRQARACCIGA